MFMRNSKFNNNTRRSWYGKNSEVRCSALKGEVFILYKDKNRQFF
jgi:hypothetical protein